MEIERATFGTITIDGKTYEHDVFIRLSGEVARRKKNLSKKYYGTSHVLSKDEAKFSLTVWATVNGSRVFCEIPRFTIHGVPLLSDEISWEISRDRAAIFDRLRPAVVAKIVRSRDNSIRLHSSDVSASALELAVG